MASSVSDDDSVNIVLKELFSQEPVNIISIASLLPTVNAPLCQKTIINNFERLATRYPFDIEKDADYGIDYGPKDIYSDCQINEILTEYMLDNYSTIGENRIRDLIANIVNEGGIVMGSCAHVRDLLKNIPCPHSIMSIELSNITAEDIIFIQCLFATSYRLVACLFWFCR